MTKALKYVQGDATQPAGLGEKQIFIPHIVNNIGVWGAGFVNAITARWGEGPRRAYEYWFNNPRTNIIPKENDDINFEALKIHYAGSKSGFLLGSVQYVHLPNKIRICNMVGQHQVRGMDQTGRPPIRYAALTEAMKDIELVINGMPKELIECEIHCPKFGSELAGGNWECIEQLILEIWVDRGIDVTIYEFKR